MVTSQILQTSVIAKTFVTDSSDFHFSELSENKKDLVVESWHYVESHLAEVKSENL